jgi:hypothetical protein
MNLDTRDGTKWLAHKLCYRGLTATLNTKIGLSIGAAIGSSSLRDELPNFARGENDRQPFRKPRR